LRNRQLTAAQLTAEYSSLVVELIPLWWNNFPRYGTTYHVDGTNSPSIGTYPIIGTRRARSWAR